MASLRRPGRLGTHWAWVFKFAFTVLFPIALALTPTCDINENTVYDVVIVGSGLATGPILVGLQREYPNSTIVVLEQGPFNPGPQKATGKQFDDTVEGLEIVYGPSPQKMRRYVYKQVCKPECQCGEPDLSASCSAPASECQIGALASESTE